MRSGILTFRREWLFRSVCLTILRAMQTFGLNSDVVLGVTIPSRNARGRVARLGGTLDAILANHGYPLAMAAGQAVFDVVANEEFLANVRQMGERLRSALEQMMPNHDHLFDSVRGVGLMLGIKMKADSRAFVTYLRTKGILTVAAGDNVMRVLPPLIIDESHIREFVEGLSAAAAEYEVPAAAA